MIADRVTCGACDGRLGRNPEEPAAYVCPGCRRVTVSAAKLHADVAERTLARMIRPDAVAALTSAGDRLGKQPPPLTAEGLVGWWESANDDQRRGLVATLVDRVIVDPGTPGTYDPDRVRLVWH